MATTLGVLCACPRARCCRLLLRSVRSSGASKTGAIIKMHAVFVSTRTTVDARRHGRMALRPCVKPSVVAPSVVAGRVLKFASWTMERSRRRRSRVVLPVPASVVDASGCFSRLLELASAAPAGGGRRSEGDGTGAASAKCTFDPELERLTAGGKLVGDTGHGRRSSVRD